eukprot:12914487-Prorocentrum_lima.AAC.1
MVSSSIATDVMNMINAGEWTARRRKTTRTKWRDASTRCSSSTASSTRTKQRETRLAQPGKLTPLPCVLKTPR